MHENADLAGMRRAEIEHVKAFASRQVDRARPAYGRVREDRPRRSIEWGTTNNDEYLLSQTGNRRFWPLKTGKIDLDALMRDREQLLGEAATYEAGGRVSRLTLLFGAVRKRLRSSGVSRTHGKTFWLTCQKPRIFGISTCLCLSPLFIIAGTGLSGSQVRMCYRTY
jgi:hypothetical protein